MPQQAEARTVFDEIHFRAQSAFRFTQGTEEGREGGREEGGGREGGGREGGRGKRGGREAGGREGREGEGEERGDGSNLITGKWVYRPQKV